VRKNLLVSLDQKIGVWVEGFAARVKADIELQQQKQWQEGFLACKEGLELDFGRTAAAMRMHYPVDIKGGIGTRCGCGQYFPDGFDALHHQVEMVRQAMGYPR